MCAVSDDEIRREEDYAATMMATANLMIAAESLGLGTYLKTGGIMRDPEVEALVGLADGFRIVGVVAPRGPRRTGGTSQTTPCWRVDALDRLLRPNSWGFRPH